MKTIPVYTRTITRLADLHSPTGIYARIRRHFPETILLESNEYQSLGTGCSVICVDPIARFESLNGHVSCSVELDTTAPVKDQLQAFFETFKPVDSDVCRYNGFFGYVGYCAVQHFEALTFNRQKYTSDSQTADIPEILYRLFRIVIVIQHRHHTISITQNSLYKPVTSDDGLERIVSMMTEPLPQEYSFRIHGTEMSSYSDDEFIACVENLQKSIAYGDIFQAVLSRRFSQAFEGDDFQVYRALRSINPSPYLYYYDLGCFRLFGSSPETALIVEGHKAILNPIAGTAPRTGDASLDQKRISQLLEDTKEASEHVMLVDLARNDLSRQCFPVSVDEFRSIHSYSHVTHLVSSVSGIRPAHVSATQIFFDVFPAGTVSGAPKYRAMELIDAQEPVARSFYGGAIGLYGFDGSCTHALTIRSILSKDNNLIYQAGAGIVSQSKAEYECNEINAKVAALRQAIIQGELICG